MTLRGQEARLAGFHATRDRLLDEQKPELDALERATRTNEYWMGALAGAQMDERKLKLIRDARPGLETVTPADVQRVARKYLTDERAWKLVVSPK